MIFCGDEGNQHPKTPSPEPDSLKSSTLDPESRAFFVGMKATIMRDVPWNALSFLFFNAFKMMYEGLRDMVLARAPPP